MFEIHEKIISLEEQIKIEKEKLMDEVHYLVMNHRCPKKVPWYKIPGKIFYLSILPWYDPIQYEIIMKTLERIKTTNLQNQKENLPQN